jgi:hypothetical protein
MIYTRIIDTVHPLFAEFISRPEVPVLLEVEHPTDELSRRRIDFYKRAGFVHNEHKYRHPVIFANSM